MVIYHLVYIEEHSIKGRSTIYLGGFKSIKERQTIKELYTEYHNEFMLAYIHEFESEMGQLIEEIL